MTQRRPEVTEGVNTHGRTHHAAVIDSAGRHLAGQEFPATAASYRDVPDRMNQHTGAYGPN